MLVLVEIHPQTLRLHLFADFEVIILFDLTFHSMMHNRIGEGAYLLVRSFAEQQQFLTEFYLLLLLYLLLIDALALRDCFVLEGIFRLEKSDCVRSARIASDDSVESFGERDGLSLAERFDSGFFCDLSMGNLVSVD